MAKKENKLFRFFNNYPKDEFVFICYLWIVILFSIIDFMILFPFTLKSKDNTIKRKPLLAIVLVDAVLVDEITNVEDYLMGYRVECSETDISNSMKTPNVIANLNSQSFLKYSYTITNNTSAEMHYYVDIIKDYDEKNLRLSYSFDELAEQSLENDYILGQIMPKNKIVINLFVRIDDKLKESELSGSFLLNLTYFNDNDINEGDANGS